MSGAAAACFDNAASAMEDELLAMRPADEATLRHLCCDDLPPARHYLAPDEMRDRVIERRRHDGGHRLPFNISPRAFSRLFPLVPGVSAETTTGATRVSIVAIAGHYREMP